MTAFLIGLFMASTSPAVLTAHLFLPPVEASVLDYSTTSLRAYATEVATVRGLHVQRFLRTIACESGFRWDAVGDKGTSLGIAQFRFPERDWGFSSSTALNPYQAINKMADAWERGLAYKWTCWNLLNAPDRQL